MLSSSFLCPCTLIFTFDRSVGIATGYRLDDRRVGVRVAIGSKLSLLHVVLTGYEFHLTSYSMGTGDFFPGGKAVGA
jgi:hypothetical protein